MGARQTGFTLIELLIVVAVLGIILVIALPSFNAEMLRSRRSLAKTDLAQCALLQERWRASNPTYGTMTQATCVLVSSPPNYTYAASAVTGKSFTITATAQNAQAGDSDCLTMTINQSAEKAPALCWR